MRSTISPILSLIILSASLGACTANDGAPPATASQIAQKCGSDGLEAFVGKTATAELGADLLAKSGARSLRWGPPNSAMTMDYREDRLNIAYDEAMLVTRIGCG